MKFVDWIKDVVSVPEEDDIEENVTGEVEETVESLEEPVSILKPFVKPKEQPVKTPVNTTGIKVVLAKPETFEDGRSVADHVNAKRTVVLNLEETNKEICRRLIDFLSGVAYANNGQLKRVANSTYIITPKTVDIMGDMIIDELESSGLYINV